jgi:hypothetical protein
MSLTSISLNVKSNDSVGLQLTVKFNNILIQSFVLTEEVQNFYHEFDNSPSSHSLEIEIKGKRPDHSVLNEHGEIVKDVVAEIFDLKLANIDIGDVFYYKSVYFHNYNGSTKPTVNQFYKTVGCNGIIKFNFYSPVYLWLYENM